MQQRLELVLAWELAVMLTAFVLVTIVEVVKKLRRTAP
jgi:hypothetical protein